LIKIEKELAVRTEFVWPKGTAIELRVYPTEHPQRKPTEQYFEEEVRRSINEVRNGEYANVWLLVASLKGLNEDGRYGFETWYWAIGGVLGKETCREIGRKVCDEEKFTIKEGEKITRKLRWQKRIERIKRILAVVFNKESGPIILK
jgi:hypothetical protein